MVGRARVPVVGWQGPCRQAAFLAPAAVTATRMVASTSSMRSHPCQHCLPRHLRTSGA